MISKKRAERNSKKLQSRRKQERRKGQNNNESGDEKEENDRPMPKEVTGEVQKGDSAVIRACSASVGVQAESK